MKKTIVLKHQNEMKYSKEFFQMEIPNELSLIIYIIVIICLTIIFIIFFGKIDEVIKTQGYVRTKENVSSVKNVISGKIIELNYKPGEKVSKNDVLYKIDDETYKAQRNMYIKTQENLDMKISGLKALKESYANNKNLCDNSDLLSYSRFDAYQKSKEVLEIKTTISKKEYLFEKQKPNSIKNPYEINMKLQSYNLALADLESYKKNFIANINSELNDKEKESYDNHQNILKLDNQYLFLEVRAPISGFVQELASLNIGDYIESNSKVLNIVPNDNKNFRVEIQILPKDMGKISEGKKVKYRLSAFPFYEYKGANGLITSIDPDIRTSSDGKKVYYSVYADIDRTFFSNKNGETFPIRAGLETDVRIVLDKKPIIFYLLKKLNFIN